MLGTQYPNFIDGFPQLPLLIDGISQVRANDVNRIRNAIVAVEKELGINPSGTYGTVKHRFDAIESLMSVLGGIDTANTSLVVDFLSIGLEQPADKDYNIAVGIPYDGYIVSTTSISSSGTATGILKINSIPVGGTPNDISLAQDVVFHVANNGFLQGDNIQLAISNNDDALDVTFTVVFIRLVSSIAYSVAGMADGYVQSNTIPSTDNSVTVFDGLSGTLIKQSPARIDSSGNITGVSSIAINTSTPSSSVHINGSMALAIKTVSVNYNADNTDYIILVNATATNISITIPSASSCVGRQYHVKKIDSSSNAVSVTRTGLDTIDGANSRVMLSQYQSLTVVSNGSNWYII